MRRRRRRRRLFTGCLSNVIPNIFYFLLNRNVFFFLHRKRQIEGAGLDKWGRTNTLFTSSVSHLYKFCLVFHLFSYNKAQKAIRHIQCLLLLAIILSQPVPIIKHAGRAFDVMCALRRTQVCLKYFNTAGHDFNAFQSLERLTMAGFMFDIETTFSDNKPCGQRTDCNNECWRYRSRLKIRICSS